VPAVAAQRQPAPVGSVQRWAWNAEYLACFFYGSWPRMMYNDFRMFYICNPRMTGAASY